jgi:hypothetical protein
VQHKSHSILVFPNIHTHIYVYDCISAKNDFGTQVCGSHYGQVYIGQTGRSIDTRIKEHHRHIRLAQPDKLAVAEYSISRGHRIQLQNTKILSTQSRYMDRLIKQVLPRAELHPPDILSRYTSLSFLLETTTHCHWPVPSLSSLTTTGHQGLDSYITSFLSC